MADGVPDTETAILDAALAEVLEHGIRRTTASDIARRCGIARQTLYRYWPDAQAVFAALVTRELVAALPPRSARARATRPRRSSWASWSRPPTASAGCRSSTACATRIPSCSRGTSSTGWARASGRCTPSWSGDLATGQDAGFVRAGDPVQLAAMVLLIAQSAVQSAPLVARVAARRRLAGRARAGSSRIPRGGGVTTRIVGRTPLPSALSAQRRARELDALASNPTSTCW